MPAAMKMSTQQILLLLVGGLGCMQTVHATHDKAQYKHVALFSVDGLHSSDIGKYLAVRPNSTIASLLETAYLYPNANTTGPSDSYPGSLAQFTGGTPATTGVWYDVIYDREFFPAGSDCQSSAGTEVADDETIDFDNTQLFSGGINASLLPEFIKDGKCQKLYPHNRLRVNTVFEIVKSKGLATAYTDKHPAYDIVRGPSGDGLSTGYFPEIAAINNTVSATINYDSLHVQAFLDWLDAKTPAHSEGTLSTVPTLFGGNFQAVSVAQKTVGYENTTGNPFTPALLEAIDFVDKSLGQVVAKLKVKNLLDETLIIVASKHGQAPINARQYKAVDPTTITNATGVPVLYQVSDDIAMLFLNNTYDTQKAVDNLNAAMKGDIFKIYSNAPRGSVPQLEHGYGTVLNDSAVPDILVAPQVGVIYTTNLKKIAEHGGLSNADRNVACFVSNPGLKKKTFDERVKTQQIAPLVLSALGIDPNELQAVGLEGVETLPGFQESH